MSRQEFYDELKKRRAEKLFQAEFNQNVAHLLAEKRMGGDGVYERKREDREYKMLDEYKRPKPFTLSVVDDQYHSKMWGSLLKNCAFYYDEPEVEDKIEMKNKLQLRYDHLLPEFWTAPLGNRKELLLWA